jgi:hypothetical protein
MPCAGCGRWVQNPVWAEDPERGGRFVTCSTCVAFHRLHIAYLAAIEGRHREVLEAIDRRLAELLADVRAIQARGEVLEPGPRRRNGHRGGARSTTIDQ